MSFKLISRFRPITIFRADAMFSNQATDYIESGYNKGTIRSDIRYLAI